MAWGKQTACGTGGGGRSAPIASLRNRRRGRRVWAGLDRVRGRGRDGAHAVGVLGITPQTEVALQQNAEGSCQHGQPGVW